MSALRLDRLLTMSFFHPLRRLAAMTDERRVPILMYHSISDDPERGVPPYFQTCTSPKMFGEHMALLRAAGCQVVGLERGRELMRQPAPPDKLVVVTFDDGFRDFYTAAWPVLRQHGFGATMFLATAFIGDEPRRFKDRECMSWAEVRECRRAGIEFGAHTVNHPKLHELDFAQIRAELEVSRAVIGEHLQEPITSFAYPYAFPSADRPFVERFVDLLKSTGYDCNVTTRIGRARAGDDPFTLRRLPTNSADDGAFFMAKIRGGYDWMSWPQDAVKNLKGMFSSSRGAAQPTPCQAR